MVRVGMLLAVVVVLVVVVRAMTPDERARAVRTTLAAISRIKHGTGRGRRERGAFREALRARTRWAVVTPILVGLNAAILVAMLRGAGALSDPETLLRWGANFGPRTTNGEWWRLATSMFVHSGVLHFLIGAVTLGQIGNILERLVGRFAFAAVYLAAGFFASLVSLLASPTGMSVGASGAIFGLYGLLLASWLWGAIHPSNLTIPLAAMKRLAPAAAVFVLYNVITDSLGSGAELTGLALGFSSGLVLARGVSEHTPPERLVTTAMATTVVMAVIGAVPVRGLTDIRPELERLVVLEQRTAAAYQTAADRLREGRTTAEAVAQLIDSTILPEFEAAEIHLQSLQRVPPEHKPLIAGAEEYVGLRSASWRLRAEVLREGTVSTRRAAERVELASEARLRAETQYRASLNRRGRADSAERAALEALQRIPPVSGRQD